MLVNLFFRVVSYFVIPFLGQGHVYDDRSFIWLCIKIFICFISLAFLKWLDYDFTSLRRETLDKGFQKSLTTINWIMGAYYLVMQSLSYFEYVQGIRHLKSYGLVGDHNLSLDKAYADLRQKSIRLEAVPGPTVTMAYIVLEIGFILMLALGLYYLTHHEITIPVLMVFLILGYNLYNPVKVVLVDYLMLRYMNESLTRVIEVLEEPTMDTAENEFPTHFDIAFHEVDFAYLPDKLTLSGLNFTIPEHSMVALVGHSGSGKTTIASLIARFWDVTKGRITIGGVDIRHIPTDRFYGLISEVFQEVYLFDDNLWLTNL